MTLSSSHDYANLHILIIDDDDFQTEYIHDLLQEIGIGKLSTAESGSAGLLLLQKERSLPDLILCDIQMPGIDGFELMKLFGDNDYMGGIVLMSGQGAKVLYSASLVAQLARLNFLGTLEKPLQKESIIALLEKLPTKNQNQC